jgi:polar amino acid transport system ATP-binding protein
MSKALKIELSHVTKRFGDHTVLNDVHLGVREGEVVAMLGPSGAGKSTLLRCVNLLERPDSGAVRVGDQAVDVKAIRPRDLQALRRKAGMVFQSFNLFPHLTVLQNVNLAQQSALGRTKQDATARSMSLIARVGLEDKANQYPSRLSGGQQQRIAIARALAMDPEVMLFDEPTSALDPELGLEVLAVMRELADSGMTMIVVTHEIQFAREVAEEVVVMAEGVILEKGPARELISNPQHERTQRFLRAVAR